jgi:hypothetical protein
MKHLESPGKRNTTITGKPCRNWDKINNKILFSTNTDIDTSLNYCRDPSNFGFNWCFVELSNDVEQWEPCQLEGDKYP